MCDDAVMSDFITPPSILLLLGDCVTKEYSATGTSEVGGWSTRELLSILDGLEGLDVVGADVGMCTSAPYFYSMRTKKLTD